MRCLFHLVLTVGLVAVGGPAIAQVNVEQLNPQPRPPDRRSCGAALQPLGDREQMWSFGGFAGGSLSDLWRFDTAALTWTEVIDTNPPSGRDQHALAWDAGQQRVILFGGVRQQGFTITHLNDVWSFNPATSAWTQLSTNAGPSIRSSPVFFYLPHRSDFLLFGGWDVRPSFPFGVTGTHLGDMWRLKVNAANATATWSSVSPPNPRPSARAATCSGYDEARHKIVMFGGQTDLDSSTNGITVAETWELDIDTLSWTLATTTNPPPKRSFCASTFDSQSQRLLVYGGQDGADLLDGMFSYDPASAAWTTETTDLPMIPMSDQASIFSPLLGSMVMFGGRTSPGGTSVYTDETFTLSLQAQGPPVCDAGADQIVNEGALVTLDGSASADPDGSPLSFAWRQTSGPSVVVLNLNSVAPTFTAPTLLNDATLVFELTVDDGLDAATNSVTITVRDVFNDAPVADAGADLVVIEGTLVTLDGSASRDPDGDALGFSWLQIAGPPVVLDDPSSPAPRFIAPAAATRLEFSLVVDDGADASPADLVEIAITDAANAPPVASAGPDIQTPPGIDVALDGSASSDPNGAALTFAWTQLSGPPIVLDDPTSVRPGFFAPVVVVDTVIVLRLIVDDGVFGSGADDVSVTVRPSLGPPRFASAPRNIAVSGTPYSYDGDDTAAATGTGTRFALVSGPTGLSVDPNTGLVLWTPEVAGTFAVELLADNALGEDTQRFNVEVYAPALITSTPATTFDLGGRYHYDEDDSASAVGSTPVSWSLVQGPVGMVVDVATGRITWVPLFPESVTVRLRVENAFGVDEQEFVAARPPETVPHIARTANPFAAVGHPYLYDDDNAVGLENKRPGDRVTVVPRPPVPAGLILVPQEEVAQIFWRPEAEGLESITLSLLSTAGAPLDLYEFNVDVVTLDPEGLARAAAAASPTSGAAPLRVSFDGGESHGSSGAPVFVYAWSTGDGGVVGNIVSVGTAANPVSEHTYAIPGSYTAELQIIDAYGVFAVDKVAISVLDGTRQPPTARIIADVRTGHDQVTVKFSCDCVDPDGDALAGVLWSYGDGTTATELSPTHTYVQPGNYRARLTTFDNDGLTGTDSVGIEVRAGDLAPPQARITASPGAEGDEPMNVVLEADTGDDDGLVVEVRWSLPDGSVRTGPRIETTFPTPGYFPVLLEAEDNDGLVGRDILTVAVRSDGVRAPLIVSQPSAHTATVGIPWRYDSDGRASSQGGRPIVWRLGKRVDGQLINAPAGMDISVDGLLSFTPSAAQVGEQPITLIAENSAGTDLQEFTITVQDDGTGPDSGCGCQETSPLAQAPFATLLLLLVLRRPSRTRVGARLLGLALLPALPLSAAPVFTSSAPGTANAGELFDHVAAVDAEPPVVFALAAAPAGMVVDSVDGRLRWMPTKAGRVDVLLLAADRSGVSEQPFTLDVAGGTPAAFDFVEPEGGFEFRTDDFGTIEADVFIVPAVGDEPKQFYAEGDRCMFMLSNGSALFHRGFASLCAPTLSVANRWGGESRTLDVAFVEPPAAEQIFFPVLAASTLEGSAPLVVSFDGTASRMPVDDLWDITVVFFSGEAAGEPLGSDPALMTADYVYTKPGTYQAILSVVANDRLASLVSVQESSSVTIVVSDEGVRPPTTTLIADQLAGPAPHAVRFNSVTVPSDAPLVAYTLDFDDGARFEVTTSAFGSFSEPSPSHVYGQPGSYRAHLSVIDGRGREARSEVEILVRAEAATPPLARIFAFPSRGEVPLTVNLSAEVSDEDGYVVSRAWILPGGTLSAEPSPRVVIDEPGEHTIELVVVDDSGLQTRARASVAATRDGVLPPRVVSVPNTHAVAGQPWRYDEDGLLSVSGGGPYRFGLGKVLQERLVNAPAGMTLGDGSGALAWTPAPDIVGEVAVTILVENTAGSTLHEFLVLVEPSTPTLGPQAPPSCAGSGAFGLSWALAVLGIRRRSNPARRSPMAMPTR